MPDKQTSDRADLVDENRRLRLEVQRLSNVKSKTPKRKGWQTLLRDTAVVMLVILSLILVFAGNLFFWAGRTLVDTDRYVATVGPLVENPEVQSSVAAYTTTQLFDNVDVQGYVAQALPPRADFLAPQLTSGLESATKSTLQKIIASPQFKNVWYTVQRDQHQRLIKFISNYEGSGTVNLNDIFNQLTVRLKDTKLSFLSGKQLPAKVGTITVINSTWLPTAHRVVTHINTWRLLSIILLVIFLAAAIYLSRRRRRTLYIFALATVAVMLITLILVRLARNQVAAHVKAAYADGAKAAAQTILHPLVIQSVLILCVAVLASVITWISGPSDSAVKVKSWFEDLFSGKLHQKFLGGRENKFLRWMRTYKRLIEWLVVSVGAAILLLVSITPLSLLVYVLVIVFLVVCMEVFAGARVRKTEIKVK